MHRAKRLRIWLLSGFALFGAAIAGVSPLGLVAGEAPTTAFDPLLTLLGVGIITLALLILLGEVLFGRRKEAKAEQMRVA